MSEESDTGTETGLPASYEQIWGVRASPTKGPKRAVSLEQIVEAGVRVALRDGVDAVSMSRVAGEVGLSAMALYRYVASKNELLALMIDQAMGVMPEVPVEDGWRAGMERWSNLELAKYREHGWALRVPIMGPPVTPNQLSWMEQGLRCLRDTGLEPHEKLSVILMVTNYTRGWATVSSDIEAAQAAGDVTTLTVMANYGDIINKVADPDRFAELRQVVAAGVFEGGLEEEEEPDFDYHFGLNRLLDGIELLLRERSA
jgi:AcrR family transcriptional regulator